MRTMARKGSSTRRGSRRIASDPARDEVLRLIDEAFKGPAWHGPSVLHALRGVNAQQALHQTSASDNRIWDVVLHLAYSKYIVARRLSPDSVGSFPRVLERAWWPGLLEEDGVTIEQAWKRDLQLLRDAHAQLRNLVTELPPVRLGERRPRKRFTLGQEVSGLALHDAYHAGQIRLMVLETENGKTRN